MIVVLRSGLCRVVRLLLLVMVVFPAIGRTSERAPSQALMGNALDKLEHIIGSEIAEAERVWLRERWTENAVWQPEATIEWLESISLAAKLSEDGTDPLALAQMRHRVIDQLYCASLQTTDPDTHRSRAFVATPERILAADCITGAIVTPFDVAAVARSNALVATWLGMPSDAAAFEAELRDMLPEDLSTMSPAWRQRLLWGEVRASALDAFLTSVDEKTRDAFVAAARSIFDERKDIAFTALVAEKDAFERLDDVRVLARKDGHRFGPDDLAALLRYMEFATGANFSPSERVEVTGMMVRNFEEDPEATLKGAANVAYWLDKGRHFGKDPATGKIRSWTNKEKAAAHRGEAVHLFCSNQSPDDADGVRLVEILFGHNPVIESDCDAKSLTRESERVVAVDGDYKFTRATLNAHRRAFERIFAFRFTPEERRWFDAAAIADVERGRLELTKAIDGFQRIVGEIDEPSAIGPHLNEYRREDYAISVYCLNKDAKDKDVVRLLETINNRDPIVHADCERSKIIRESDVDGRIASFNLISAIAGREPLTRKEENTLRKDIATNFKSFPDGPLFYRSESVKFNHWWARMPFEVRRRNAEEIRQSVTSLQTLFDMRKSLSSKATLNLNLMSLCDLSVTKLKHNTKMAQLRAKSIHVQDQWGGWTWINPADVLYAGTDTFNALSPLVKHQCERAWQ